MGAVTMLAVRVELDSGMSDVPKSILCRVYTGQEMINRINIVRIISVTITDGTVNSHQSCSLPDPAQETSAYPQSNRGLPEPAAMSNGMGKFVQKNHIRSVLPKAIGFSAEHSIMRCPVVG